MPPIMDPIYGYQAVNVEAQDADQHSLLNWMRRMLEVRKRHRAFGRGTQNFLYPGNRKVLAYTRCHPTEDGHDETLLCVYNLSRSAQAVELDLRSFNGRVPVDIIGGSVFPPIGQLTYLLTLPPYGFYWFLLATEQALPSWHAPTPEPLPDLSTIVVRNLLTEIATGSSKRLLEKEVLPAYLPKRRWFSSKSETLGEIGFAYVVPFREDRDNSSLLTEIVVKVGDRVERYCLPLGVVTEDDALPLAQQLALTRIRRGPLVGYVTDGFATDNFVSATLDMIGRNDVIALDEASGGGRIVFSRTERFDQIERPAEMHVRRLSAEQSNSSMIIDDQLVLKVVRKVLSGVHPEAEISRYLTQRGFANTPPLYGRSPSG